MKIKRNNMMEILTSQRFLLIEKVEIWGEDVSDEVDIFFVIISS